MDLEYQKLLESIKYKYPELPIVCFSLLMFSINYTLEQKDYDKIVYVIEHSRAFKNTNKIKRNYSCSIGPGICIRLLKYNKIMFYGVKEKSTMEYFEKYLKMNYTNKEYFNIQHSYRFKFNVNVKNLKVLFKGIRMKDNGTYSYETGKGKLQINRKGLCRVITNNFDLSKEIINEFLEVITNNFHMFSVAYI